MCKASLIQEGLTLQADGHSFDILTLNAKGATSVWSVFHEMGEG